MASMGKRYAAAVHHMDTTSWRVIRNAAAGEQDARAEFVARYSRVARVYFSARWTGTPLVQEVNDAIQQVFLECFRHGGVLHRAEPGRAAGFRAYFHGLLRNSARRVESDPVRRKQIPATSDFVRQGGRQGEDGLSKVFDRAWASAMVKEAGALMERRARRSDERALRRVKLLRLRFEEGMATCDIARLWDTELIPLHREYERARKEFKVALMDVLGNHMEGTPGEIERECYALLALLRSD